MKRKQQELKPVAEPQDAIAKKPNKFMKVIEKIGKRNIIIACSVLLIGAAVLVNWILISKANKKTEGYQNYNQQNQTEQQSTPTSTSPTQSYFSATQVSRQRARDEALEVLQSVVDNNDASETVKSKALAEIAVIADEIRKEADIETLITAKGFEDCVAVLNGDSISIVVKAESLQPAQIAQINEIVYQETGIAPTGVTIIQKA